MDNNMDNNPNGNRPDPNKDARANRPTAIRKIISRFWPFWYAFWLLWCVSAMFTNMLKDNSSEITYDKFIEMVNDG